jgi:flagellar hook protein FlgE
MLISNATMRALDEIAARERDLVHVYAPGAMPEHGDVAQTASSTFTLDPLSAAAPADAYFVTADDSGRMMFTRDGSFAIKDGKVVDSTGHAMFGYRDNNSAIAPLQIDPVDVALGFTSNARVEADGNVTYECASVDPRTGKREVHRAGIGRLALARFAPGTKLQTIDAQHAAAGADAAPHLGRPGDGNFGPLTPHARSTSGIDFDLGLQRLQDAYLALDAIRAAGKAQGSVQKTTMDLLK